MKKEMGVATLTTNDLQSAGINSQLTSNDLVEVVAHDIYDKYLTAINDIIDKGKSLETKYYKLMNAEVGKMKKALGKYLKKEEVTVVDDLDRKSVV